MSSEGRHGTYAHACRGLLLWRTSDQQLSSGRGPVAARHDLGATPAAGAMALQVLLIRRLTVPATYTTDRTKKTAPIAALTWSSSRAERFATGSATASASFAPALETGLAERDGIHLALIPGARGPRRAGLMTSGRSSRRRGHAVAAVSRWPDGDGPSSLVNRWRVVELELGHDRRRRCS